MPIHNATENPVPEAAVETDWPANMPILDGEMELLEEHLLDILSVMIQHG